MLTADKVLVLDPLLAAISLLLTVWCIIRLTVSIWVYHDATELGSDAMSWMGLVCVLGLIGVIVWLVVRPKSRYPYTYNIPYYPKAPPGQMYQMRLQPVPQPYPPPEIAQGPPTTEGKAPQQAQLPPLPQIGAANQGEADLHKMQGSAPPQIGAANQGEAALSGAQWPAPPPGYVYVTPGAQWRTPPFNPYSVRRMIATFIAAIAFANYIVTPIMMAWILQLPSLNIDTLMTDIMTPEMLLLSTAIQDGLLLYFTWLVMFRRKHLSLPGLGLRRDDRTAGLVLLGLLAGLALFALNYAVSWPIAQSGITDSSQSIFDMKGKPWGLFLIGMATVLIAPVTEEIFFRGYALATVERKWGAPAGILLSAIMFAAVHLSIPSFLPIFVIGVALAMLCRKFGLIPCIAAHAVNNLLAVVLMYLGYG